jgi:hypothetical protein
LGLNRIIFITMCVFYFRFFHNFLTGSLQANRYISKSEDVREQAAVAYFKFYSDVSLAVLMKTSKAEYSLQAWIRTCFRVCETDYTLKPLCQSVL